MFIFHQTPRKFQYFVIQDSSIILGLLEESLKHKGKLSCFCAALHHSELFIAGYRIVLSLFHHKWSHIWETKSLLPFWDECPRAQFAEFVTSPLDIIGFKTTARLYFRKLLRK